MYRFSLIALCASTALIAGCASQNPYDSNHTATYGGIGALVGAAAGALIDHDNRGQGALIGAALGGAAGAGYGYYADRQEQQLRQSMAGTGVQVERQGDVIQLVMPGNITFATDSAQISPSFYQPLTALANSFREYNQNSIAVVGYTDSTGSYNYNLDLSQRRAQAVAEYLQAQGVNSSRISTQGLGPADPIASNASAEGRAQNRRVEITLRPLPGAQ
jgi:outer membrane protein OmpA-like peptidoglycan-associated protein